MKQLNDYEISCQKCGKKFTLKLTESQYIKNKYRKHCSRSCANSRTFSNESIEKKRIAALNNKKKQIDVNTIIKITLANTVVKSLL